VICKTIRHPNIVECYDIYEDKENYYIVMEYCEDGTLKDKLEQYTTIPESEAKDIIA
jgi:serine/threonine protein kinase